MPQDAVEHRPVMLSEALEGLAIRPDGFYIDCTFGRGGHSWAILSRLGPEGRLLALDKDPAAVQSDSARILSEDRRFAVERAGFAELRRYVEQRDGLGRVSGILMDLGVSSPQLDDPARGFSFLRDGPLNMRMDSDRGPTAADWLASVSEADLAKVLRDYGEERFARRIARSVVDTRQVRPIETTRQLAMLIEKAVPVREKTKHPATRSFQAIRIAVNRELEELESVLEQALDVLEPGGRLVVIAFHSLEDRIVKRFMREQELGKPVPSRLPIFEQYRAKMKRIGKARMPSAAETEQNVRSRSAVMRVAERVAG
jgi:16S rRNA (cytosine1402-N4)-methyltransferase